MAHPSTRPLAVQQRQMESVRDAMLDCVRVDAEAFHAIQRKLRAASDVLELWYLRDELMGILALEQGEAAARSQLNHIRLMFAGLVPQGLYSAPSLRTQH